MLIAVDNFGSHGVFQLLLNRPAEVAGTVGHGIGLFNKELHQAVTIGEGDALISKRGHQLVQHNFCDSLEILLGKTVKRDNAVYTVNKLRTQELLQRLHSLIGILLRLASVKADGAAILIAAAGIGGHDDDGIFKIHSAAVRIRNLTVIQNLQQHIQYIGMRLFDLVKQNDRIGLAAYLFRQLSGLVIADIARRRAYDS